MSAATLAVIAAAAVLLGAAMLGLAIAAAGIIR